MHERKENNTEKIQSQNQPKRQVFHVRFVDLFKRELNWLAGLCWVTLVERFRCGLFGAAVCHVSIKMMVMIKNELQNDSWKIMCI